MNSGTDDPMALSFTPAIPFPVKAPSDIEKAALADYHPKSSEAVNATVAAIEKDAVELRRLRNQDPTSEAKGEVARRQSQEQQLADLQARVRELRGQ
jgi:hypothetical protein